MGLLDNNPDSGGLLSSLASLLGVNPAYGAMAGNAARGALAGMGAAAGMPGFGNQIGRGALGGMQSNYERQQQTLRQKLGYQQLQTGGIEQQNAQRQNRLGTITENYYRRMNGLPELPVDWAGGQQQGQQPDSGGAPSPSNAAPQMGASPQAPAGVATPGVPAAATPLSKLSYGSDDWWQALYAQGQAMVGVPGMANDAVTLMEKAKAHDPTVLQSEAFAKATGEARAKGFDLDRPGATHYGYGPDGKPQVIAQNPIQMPGVDSGGNKTTQFMFPPTAPGAPPQGAGQPQQGLYQPRSTNGIDNIYDLADAQVGNPPGSSRVLAGLETAGSKDTGPGSISFNGKGAGRMQINPDTVPQGTKLDNPFTNVQTGAARLHEYQQKYGQYGQDNALWLGAAAYNWGPGNVDKWIAAGGKPDAIPPGVVKYANDYLGGIQNQQQPAAPPAAAPAQPPGTFTTELGPQQKKEFEGQGERFNTMRKTADDEGTAALSHRALLDEMGVASQGFKMGAGANLVGTAQAWGNYLGINSEEANKQLADFQQMKKQAITVGSSAIQAVSSREAMQGQKMIWEAQPNPAMSEGGFKQIVDSLGGIDDFKIAKQQWAKGQPLGTNIDAEWNKHVTPNAFWVHRMSADDLKVVTSRLSQTPQGRTLLGNIVEQMQWAQQNGLMDQ